MTDALQIIGSAMHLEADTVRVISENVANAQTTAYRRQVGVSRLDFQTALDSANAKTLSPIAPHLEVVRDTHAGTLRHTGEPLDVAINGSGYFLLQSEAGMVLTRRGDFHLDAEGTLVSHDNRAVLGQSGAIRLNSSAVTIGADGSVQTTDGIVDRLRIVDTLPEVHLESVGDGTYVTTAENLNDTADSTRLQQGFLETSNVSPVNELMQLMESVRRFEAEQRFARTYDDILSKSISELGKT